MSESLMSAALRYAQLGYAVFPCAPGRKVPMVTNGRNAATTDAQQIEAWWAEQPRANIGIATDDLIVIDIDGSDNGWPHEPELGAQLASAATSMTPRGGRHHVYRQPDGNTQETHSSLSLFSLFSGSVGLIAASRSGRARAAR